jgi:hypothetical protein
MSAKDTESSLRTARFAPRTNQPMPVGIVVRSPSDATSTRCFLTSPTKECSDTCIRFVHSYSGFASGKPPTFIFPSGRCEVTDNLSVQPSQQTHWTAERATAMPTSVPFPTDAVRL